MAYNMQKYVAQNRALTNFEEKNSRKYNYLQFPTIVQLGRMCPVPGHIRPKGGARSPLHV